MSIMATASSGGPSPSNMDIIDEDELMIDDENQEDDVEMSEHNEQAPDDEEMKPADDGDDGDVVDVDVEFNMEDDDLEDVDVQDVQDVSATRANEESQPSVLDELSVKADTEAEAEVLSPLPESDRKSDEEANPQSRPESQTQNTQETGAEAEAAPVPETVPVDESEIEPVVEQVDEPLLDTEDKTEEQAESVVVPGAEVQEVETQEVETQGEETANEQAEQIENPGQSEELDDPEQPDQLEEPEESEQLEKPEESEQLEEPEEPQEPQETEQLEEVEEFEAEEQNATEEGQDNESDTTGSEEKTELLKKIPILLHRDNDTNIYYLFPPNNNSNSNDDNESVLFRDYSVGENSVEDLFRSLREAFAEIGEEYSLENELTFNFPQLGLQLGEDNCYSRELTLYDVVLIFSDLCEQTPEDKRPDTLEVVLGDMPRFISTFNYLSDLVKDGKGLESLYEQEEDDEDSVVVVEEAGDDADVVEEVNVTAGQDGAEQQDSSEIVVEPVDTGDSPSNVVATDPSHSDGIEIVELDNADGDGDGDGGGVAQASAEAVSTPTPQQEEATEEIDLVGESPQVSRTLDTADKPTPLLQSETASPAPEVTTPKKRSLEPDEPHDSDTDSKRSKID